MHWIFYKNFFFKTGILHFGSFNCIQCSNQAEDQNINAKELAKELEEEKKKTNKSRRTMPHGKNP